MATSLTEHFTLEELIHSDTAAAHGIDNTPSATTKAQLMRLAFALEDVRRALEHPVWVTSGYRCPALNDAVGGVKDSAHLVGLAADIVCPPVGDAREVARKILSRGPEIRFDQLIVEYASGSTPWVHFGLCQPDRMPRRMVLTMTPDGVRPGVVWPAG